MTDTRDTRWFLDRMPQKDALEWALRGGNPEKRLLNIAIDRAIKEIGFDLVEKDAGQQVVKATIDLAIAAAKRIAENGPTEELTAEEKAALDLFLLLVSRPAIFVQGGTVRERPENWKEIGRDELLLPRIIAGVGRLDTAEGVKKGTGFLVADKRILTNNHVLCALFGVDLNTWFLSLQHYSTLCDEHSKLWEEDESAAPIFEMRGEFGSTVSLKARVRKILGHHANVDMAVLELDATPAGARVLPLLADEPPDFKGRRVYAVGFPIEDSGAAPSHIFARIFGSDPDSLGTKRFSPGTIMDWDEVNAFRHDAATLPGSSGSCIVDFEKRRVVGLHRAGAYRDKNLAIPLWKFRADPLLAGNGIEFG